MRNISFAMTTEQFRRGEKDVTRRFGWWFLKPGDQLRVVEKTIGLKKGEKMVEHYGCDPSAECNRIEFRRVA